MVITLQLINDSVEGLVLCVRCKAETKEQPLEERWMHPQGLKERKKKEEQPLEERRKSPQGSKEEKHKEEQPLEERRMHPQGYKDNKEFPESSATLYDLAL